MNQVLTVKKKNWTLFTCLILILAFSGVVEAAVTRKIRLFEGSRMKLVSGRIIQHKELLLSGDTGFMSPAATGEIFNQWTTPSNAFSSNDSYATEATTFDTQDYYNFGFSVPAGATIDGIEVSLEVRSTCGTCDVLAELSWNASNNYTAGKFTTSLTGSDAIYLLGGSADTWGRTWDDSEFSNANFRIRLSTEGDAGTMSMDHVQIKVYYTP